MVVYISPHPLASVSQKYHWDPSFHSCGCPAWAIGEDGMYFMAPAEGLPMGAAPWSEYCDGAWDYSGTVALAAAALAPGECAAAHSLRRATAS